MHDHMEEVLKIGNYLKKGKDAVWSNLTQNEKGILDKMLGWYANHTEAMGLISSKVNELKVKLFSSKNTINSENN